MIVRSLMADAPDYYGTLQGYRFSPLPRRVPVQLLPSFLDSCVRIASRAIAERGGDLSRAWWRVVEEEIDDPTLERLEDGR